MNNKPFRSRPRIKTPGRTGRLFISVLLLLCTLSSPIALTSGVAADTGGKMLIPLGYTTGIKMFSDGVLIVGISYGSANTKSPAGSAGLAPGDLITEINSVKITSAEDLKNIVQSGAKLNISFIRNGSLKRVALTPEMSAEDGFLKIGAWVRDSMAGIGTLTFYDPDTGIFGALGHGINDVDTSALIPLLSGRLIRSSVSSIRKGDAGVPGELKGTFDTGHEYGTLFANTEQGVFGRARADELRTEFNAIPVADRREIKTGRATILSNIDGETVEEYEIEITRIYLDGSKAPRDMSIEITDERLIEKTGGIVQGMSGSPIIQGGKLVGAVTHVLINHPKRGYAIFIDTMLTSARESAQQRVAA